MAYRVDAYSIATLKALFERYSGASPIGIDSKLQSVYFEGYFAAVGAKTIVVEEDYIDHDYLEDFAAYYVKCFEH